MKKEILVDIGLRMKSICDFLLPIGGLLVLMFIPIYLDNYPDARRPNIENMKFGYLSLKCGIPMLAIGLLGFLLPTPKSLLKLELTNEENRDIIIQKGGDTTDKIVKKLEDKYFNKS